MKLKWCPHGLRSTTAARTTGACAPYARRPGTSSNQLSAHMPPCIDVAAVDHMCQVAGTHLTPRIPHGTSGGDDNLLSISQDIDPMHFDESAIVDLVLEPGEASFHHGWVIHGSRPNPSNRRRLGITCIFAPGNIAYDNDGVDEATQTSMRSSTSATTTGQGDVTKQPWSEGYLVKGTAEGSAVKPLSHPFPYEAPKL
jgi:hypothetical protein|eukprot:COSAG02_NODE_124_length_35047_cov_31.554179_29_plen_198_part_00